MICEFGRVWLKMALLVGLRAHNLLWRKCARMCGMNRLTMRGAGGALYTQNGGVIFIHNRQRFVPL